MATRKNVKMSKPSSPKEVQDRIKIATPKTLLKQKSAANNLKYRSEI